MKKIILLAILFTLAAGAWYILRPHTAANPHIISQSSVLSQIRQLNRLESTAFYIDTIIRTEKQGNWYALWQDSQKGLFVAKGSVTAGLDLDKLTEKHIQILPERVIINLPPAEILSVHLEHLEIYDWRTGAFNLIPTDTALLHKVQQQAKAQVLQQACRNGIIPQAKERARLQLEKLFALAGQPVSVYPAATDTCRFQAA